MSYQASFSRFWLTIGFFVIVFGVAILTAILGHLVTLPAGQLPSFGVVILACVDIFVLVFELILTFIKILLPPKSDKKKSD
jgi:uncharacterized membrane protein